MNIYSDTSTFIIDEMVIYSNDQYGSIDTIELQAGVAAQLVIDSIIAHDNRNPQPGIDTDDCVKVYFNKSIDTSGLFSYNLDSILTSPAGHSWYDGTGEIKDIQLFNDNKIIVIWLSIDSSAPTIRVGDFIMPRDSTICDDTHFSYLNAIYKIRGSFEPTGVEEGIQKETEWYYSYGSSYLKIGLSYSSELSIYDIAGRTLFINKYEPGSHIISLDLAPGIYFLNIKYNQKADIRKMVIVK